MKKILFILMLTMTVGAMAQNAPDYKEQYTKLHKAYVKDPDDVANLVALARFYSQPDNPQYDIAQSARHIHRAETLISYYLQHNDHYKTVLRLMRKDISLLTIREQRRVIDSTAYVYLKQHATEMNESELATFAEVFADHKAIYSRVSTLWLKKAYSHAKHENTIEAYYDFLLNHPSTPQADSAEASLMLLAPEFYLQYDNEADINTAAERYPESRSMQHAAMLQCSRLAFAEASKLNTIGAYNAYLERFPKGADYLEALVRIEHLTSEELSTLSTPRDFAEFALQHDDTPHADWALAHLRSMILDEHNATAARIYLEMFPLDPSYSSIYKEYYRWHASEGNEAPLRHFAEENPDYPYRIALESDLTRARGIDTIDLLKPFAEKDYEAMSTVIHQLTGKRIAFVALQRILQEQIAHHEWKKAQARLEHFSICFEEVSNREYVQLGQLLADASTGELRNETTPGDVLRAVPAPDGHALYLTILRDGKRHICFARPSQKKNARWEYAGDVSVNAEDVIVYNLFDKGKQALVGLDGDIWTARIVNDSLWQLEEHLPYPVNTEALEVDASMLDDGSGILLASDRKGGLNCQYSGEYFHGDTALATDIYIIPCNANGWDSAINLGMPVNTPYSERSPLLSRNMRTLYFISDGHAGLGYGDIFAITRSNTDDWHHWGQPRNLGKAINSAFNEQSITFNGDEGRLYITTASPSVSTCVSTPTSHDANSPLQTTALNISDLGDSLQHIDLFDLSIQPLGATIVNTANGAKLNLNKNHRYAVMAYAAGKYVPAVMIPAPAPTTVTIKGYTREQILAATQPIPLASVSFATNTARLTPISEYELRQLALFLLDNPDLCLQINCHVGGVDKQQCYDLSVLRATAIRTQLASFGVGTSRVRLMPYGNSKSNTKNPPAPVSITIYQNP